MPKRNDIKKILIIGSGPIVIGQACEFDYSGTQACKALKEEGYQVILVNSNPATIMTDPHLAHRTYIEPITPRFLEKIIIKERPDAVLPTLGGQTGLNVAMELAETGVFKKYNVEMLGATEEVIAKAEDRQKFKTAMKKIGLNLPESVVTNSLKEAVKAANHVGYPCIVRPSFTLGGTGGGIAYNERELKELASGGISKSMISEILIEKSIIGWKEFELEVMRDRKDNVVIICSIENLDPMGVHTGDSITVAPAQTLTDVEYQEMRDAAIKIIREIGVETGGANVQFAVDPQTGKLIVIEVNPRVSRSSALASKATGFPIAKFAAKLAVGYTLDELVNEITKKTPACFEPTLDYCVVKIPRFNFKKFPQAKTTLGTAMKAVGEVMAIGRTFKEALQKGIRSLETKRFGFGYDKKAFTKLSDEELIKGLEIPSPWRLYYIQYALRYGKEHKLSVKQIIDHTKIDPWFINQMREIVEFVSKELDKTPQAIRKAKEYGFSDQQLADILGFESEMDCRLFRESLKIKPTYSLVDTCAAEFEAKTPYYYSTYETECESNPSKKPKIIILGSGPNRIGQGLEFDYCCVHAAIQLSEMNIESIMINSNPETVSTDFDISDKLYFEPITFEDVLNIVNIEKPLGVIIQFGGQTPLNLAKRLELAGVKILGSSTDTIDQAEDREQFQKLLKRLNLKQPDNGTAFSQADCKIIAKKIGYPVVVRPSYVLGGASMEIVTKEDQLNAYIQKAQEISPEHPILIDKYLSHAQEIDVDAIVDETECVIASIMQHIEQAGIHSGDSACCLPPYSIEDEMLKYIKEVTIKLGLELKVKGLINIQFAIKDNQLYVIEVNPRASRTIPFVSKATGVAWAKMATQIILGKTIKELQLKEIVPPYFSIKEAVLPFNKFPEVDILLSPEMKSTGESMGIDYNIHKAFYKSQISAGQQLPEKGKVFISVGDQEKKNMGPIAKKLIELGFSIIATEGTAKTLLEEKIKTEQVNKISEGGVTILDFFNKRDVSLAFNTSSEKTVDKDELSIRQELIIQSIPYVTTLEGMRKTVEAIEANQTTKIDVQALQDYLKPEKHETSDTT